jgi:hypothetical protein
MCERLGTSLLPRWVGASTCLHSLQKLSDFGHPFGARSGSISRIPLGSPGTIPCGDGSSCLKLPGASVVLDGKGARFADVFEENQRRLWVALADIPEPYRRSSRPPSSRS